MKTWIKFSYLSALSVILAFNFACGGGGSGGKGKASDTTPPVISVVDPDDGDTDVPINTNIIATFSEDMDADTITVDSFTVSDGIGTVAGTVTYSSKIATFDPQDYLTENQEYTATVTTTAADLAGNPLEQNYTWTFTTGIEINTNPPEAADYTITVSNLISNSLTLSWEKATDDITKQSKLQYRVYQSDTNNIVRILWLT